MVENYWNLVERFRLTVIGGVPTSIAAVTNSWRPGVDVSSVRLVGDRRRRTPAAVGARFMETTGLTLFETYGMTETAAAIAFNPGRGKPRAGSVGLRSPFSETRIVRLGLEHEICDAEESGAVQVRGPQIFPGYVDRAHNKGTLSEDGWLTTGDVGYLTDRWAAGADGPREGPDRPRWPQHRSRRDRGGGASLPRRADQRRGGHARSICRRGAGAVRGAGTRQIDRSRWAQGVPRSQCARAAGTPRSVLVIDALPVTAVGKIFKPTLRDLAIKEKVRLEVERLCGAGASADMAVSTDNQKRIVVEVGLAGATAEQLAALDAALKPLPQTYLLREIEDEPVLLAFADGIATLTLNRPGNLNAASDELMRALERQLQAVAKIGGLRVVIITGSGRAFCAGGNLLEFEAKLRRAAVS